MLCIDFEIRGPPTNSHSSHKNNSRDRMREGLGQRGQMADLRKQQGNVLDESLDGAFQVRVFIPATSNVWRVSHKVL